MDLKKINYSVADGIATIEMNYIQNFNAIDEDMSNELNYCFEQAENDQEVKVVILKGQEKAFSAGGDIKYFYNAVQNDELDEIAGLVDIAFETPFRIRKLSKIVIAQVSGPAAGAGANLALSCDFVIAADNAQFTQAFINLGLVPDTGGTYLLAKDIGWHRALEMTATGRAVPAAELKDLGAVYDVVALEDLEDTVNKLAEKVLHGPTLAYAELKKQMFDAAFKEFEAFGKVESDTQKQALHTEDFKEGVFAFGERRKAEFKGK